MALPRQANVGKIYAILWYNECKSHHTENYSRHTRVRCYQCNKIRHYARDYLEKVLIRAEHKTEKKPNRTKNLNR